jgi:hypothetical protein
MPRVRPSAPHGHHSVRGFWNSGPACGSPIGGARPTRSRCPAPRNAGQAGVAHSAARSGTASRRSWPAGTAAVHPGPTTGRPRPASCWPPARGCAAAGHRPGSCEPERRHHEPATGQPIDAVLAAPHLPGLPLQVADRLRDSGVMGPPHHWRRLGVGEGEQQADALRRREGQVEAGQPVERRTTSRDRPVAGSRPSSTARRSPAATTSERPNRAAPAPIHRPGASPEPR